MKRIVKGEAPVFWKAYVGKYPKNCYNKLDSTEQGREVRNRLREHLAHQQKMICCYCCGSLEGKDGALLAHNEHIRPQSSYPNDSMDYGNLLASCNNSNTCGKAKKDLYDPQAFISPLREDCEEHFIFSENGRIKGVTEQGKRTVDILNLNHSTLVSKRKAQFDDCLRMAQCVGKEYVRQVYLKEANGELPRFVDMVSYFYRKGTFDPEICGN